MGEFLSWFWGLPMAVLLAGAGLYLSIRCGFIQLRHFPEAMRHVLGGALRRDAQSADGITPMQALCAALAGTVGTGNIAGVALAISLGGPGALFWLWLSAALGMATKYAEVTLALRFRERGDGGVWLGGPMYTIKNGLGPRFMPLARCFAFFGALGATDLAAEKELFSIVIGALVAACGFLVLNGGMKRLGRVCEALVPLMGLVYALACIAVICANYWRLGGVLRDIFVCAFRPQAVCGGIGLRACIGWGLRRGLFSNEAGLGSAPIAHSSAAETEPVRQGFYGIFEVFADTFVICTLTGLALLCSGAAIPYGSAASLSLSVSAFAGVFGGGGAAAILALCLLLFSLSSLLSWGMYGLRCCGFLLGTRSARAYLLVYSLCAVLGAASVRSQVWELADLTNALMALPNLTSLLLLSGEAARLTQTAEVFTRGLDPAAYI